MNRLVYATVLLALYCLIGAAVAIPARTADNPKPDIADLVLPMPEGRQMVFRPVRVPGRAFWGDTDRIVQIGDPEGGMFEGLQRIQVNGTFPSPTSDDYWLYYLGKYEVTKGQFIAVMGMERFLAETGNPADQRIPDLRGPVKRKALAEPLAAMSWQVIQEFIHSYNLWLFDARHTDRIKKVPRLDGVPGFIRLPTELEWEYAARGAMPALAKGTFTDTLPFARSKANKFAWHKGNAKRKARPIGLRKPTPLGFYDLFGNVQEFTAQLFLPEIWQGKPGGLVARGGSASTTKRDLRSSLRQEVGIYLWNPDRKVMEEQRSFTTGIRLSIGTNVVVNPVYWSTIHEEYEQYKTKIRSRLPVGKTLANPVAKGVSAVGLAHSGIDRLIQTNPHLKVELAHIKHYLEEAEKKMDQAQREGARSSAHDALRNATNTGNYIYKAYGLKKLKEMITGLGARYQAKLDLVNKKLGEKKEFAKEQFGAYIRRVVELGEYSDDYIETALKTVQAIAKRTSKREYIAFGLLRKHVQQYRQTRRPNKEEWWNDFDQKFKDISD